MGPDYLRPRVDAPAAFRFEPQAAAETANTAWWKQFGDPVLDALIDEALAHNLNVKIAAANVEQAAGVLTQTRSSMFPQVGYSGSGEKARTPETALTRAIPNYPTSQTAYQALLSASWEIDLWGRIRRLSEAAQANVLATDDAVITEAKAKLPAKGLPDGFKGMISPQKSLLMSPNEALAARAQGIEEWRSALAK